MTHQDESAVLEAVTAIMINHRPAARASAYSVIKNGAMQIEREQVDRLPSRGQEAENSVAHG